MDKIPWKSYINEGKTPWKNYIYMIKRKIDTVIEEHFRSSRKALFLTGARQSGKTYAIRKYAKNNGLNLVEVNFLLQPDSMAVFKRCQGLTDSSLSIFRCKFGDRQDTCFLR